ncbi:MAG: alpha/beta hydrolase [Lachnospiraceae bacterium]|nr:alpha/beta hydrolase [Lachnospiraceae bacterium]
MKKVELPDSPLVYFCEKKDDAVEWLLFLHAAFVDHRMYNAQIAYFKERYNLLLPDIIGHGESVNAKKGDSLDNMSGWIKEILDRESVEKIHITGVSLGAVLAQDFANHYPDRVKSLACFGGYDINHFDSSMQKENGGAQMRMMLKAMVSVKWFAKENRKISAYTEEAQDAFYQLNLRFPKKSFLYLATLNRMVNVCETDGRNYPLLIGCGEHDIPMEKEAVKSWAESEPDCTVKIFEGAGHCVNMDVPQAFNAALEAFWRGKSESMHTDLYQK